MIILTKCNRWQITCREITRKIKRTIDRLITSEVLQERPSRSRIMASTRLYLKSRTSSGQSAVPLITLTTISLEKGSVRVLMQ